jgi:hypothetical protein
MQAGQFVQVFERNVKGLKWKVCIEEIAAAGFISRHELKE